MFEVYASTFIYIRRVVSASCDRAVILSLDKNLQFFSTQRGKKINHFFRTTHCNRDEGCSKFLVCYRHIGYFTSHTYMEAVHSRLTNKFQFIVQTWSLTSQQLQFCRTTQARNFFGKSGFTSKLQAL